MVGVLRLKRSVQTPLPGKSPNGGLGPGSGVVAIRNETQSSPIVRPNEVLRESLTLWSFYWRWTGKILTSWGYLACFYSWLCYSYSVLTDVGARSFWSHSHTLTQDRPAPKPLCATWHSQALEWFQTCPRHVGPFSPDSQSWLISQRH